MNNWVKIKAGSVQYVLVVSVVILIILFAFISLVFLQNRLQLKSSLYKTTTQNCYAAFDLLSLKDIDYNTSKSVQFSEFDYEITTITKKHWGVFDVATVSSELKNERTIKTAILANGGNKRKALYLKDNNQPLKVVGNTEIIGDVVLPKRGVSSGNISGVSYYGAQLIYGVVQYETGDLPRIKNLTYLRELSRGVIADDFEYFNPEPNQKLRRSFTEKPWVFQTPMTLNLDGMNLSGNIIVISDKKIVVPRSARLGNIILIAPSIEIQSGFQGMIQAISSSSVFVSKGAKLSYPSALVVMDETQEDSIENIIIEKGADIKGAVLYRKDSKQGDYNVQVQIREGATVTGEVYCNQNLELLGEVHGFVYTSNFITKKSGGTFINHLYNARIDATAIADQYAGLFLGETKNTIAKWVD